MLRWRLLLGTALVGLVALICWLDAHAAYPGIWLFPVWVILCLGAALELGSMWRTRSLRISFSLVAFGVAATLTSAYLADLAAGFTSEAMWIGLASSALALSISAGAALGIAAFRYGSNGAQIDSVALAVLAYVYIGMLGTCVLQLRFAGGSDLGMLAVLSLVAVTKSGDTGAFTVGKLIGRHKLAPRLSPGKTWEGFVGALALSALAAIFLLKAVPGWMSLSDFSPHWLTASGFGICVGLAGVLGDLVESMLKRDAGYKDSSRWLPGLGGVLDILDSILFAAPVALIYWTTLLL